MANSEQDLASPSLISRIEQLEERQNIVSKYMVGLKRQFDGMTHELQQIESLKEQIKELQQRFNQLPTLSKGLDNADTLNGASESATFDEVETVKQWLERVEQPDFSRHEEKLTLDLTPQPHQEQGKGENSKPSQEQERGLERGFPDPVKSQNYLNVQVEVSQLLLSQLLETVSP